MVAFINGGSAKLSYEAPYGPNDCWPGEDGNTRDLVVFDDSRFAQTAGIAYEIKITPRSSDCD